MFITVAGKPIGPIGFGMGGLTHPGHHPETEDAIAILKAALNAGANFWNAGDIYGTPEYNSLHLLKAYFTKYPEDASKVVISVKSCFDMRNAQTHNDEKGVKAAIDRCLQVLDGKCRIDIFQACRLDPNVPVEVTVGAIVEAVRAGKVGGVGLSECSAASIKKAAYVHPIAAVEIELSLFETSIFTNGIADACKEHKIPIVAYSPLSKGFLTGQLKKYDDLPQSDYRRMFPRFQPDVFDENLRLVKQMEKIAAEKGYTVVQVALAWIVAQTSSTGVPVIPIPGASALSRVEENTKHVQLSSVDLEAINQAVQEIEVKGSRAPARFSHLLEI